MQKYINIMRLTQYSEDKSIGFRFLRKKSALIL